MRKFQSVNLDSAESLFLERELEAVKAKAYEVKVPAQRVREFIPTDSTLPPGTKSFSYRVYDQVGAAKIIASYADDLPRVDVSAREEFGRVRTLGDAYGFGIPEIQTAAKNGNPLEQRKANAARRAIEEKIQAIAKTGDAVFNLLGLLNQPNTTIYTVPNGAGGGAAWLTGGKKTPDEILADMFGIADQITNGTKNAEVPDTLILPQAHYNHIARTRLGNTSDDTILSFFLKVERRISTVEPWADLAGAGTGATNRMVCYRRDPDVLGLVIPREFEQLNSQERGLEVVTPCIAECGGVVVYYPMAMAYGDGI